MTDDKLTDDSVVAFRRDGFVAIEQVVSPRDVAQIKATLLRLHEHNVGFKEGAQFDAAGAEGVIRRFPQMLDPHTYAPELLQSEYHQVGLQIARKLLGPDAKFRGDISFVKPPLIGSETAWHQDEAFSNPHFDHKEISIWMALTEANSSNSCMSFIAGSHQWDILAHQPMNNDPQAHALECVGDFNPAQAIECPLHPGDCTVHRERTLHYAGPNTSEMPRMAYVIMYELPATLRAKPHDFPWRKMQATDRAARETVWKRRGGLFVYIWRRRHRIRLSLLVAHLRRMRSRVMRSF